MAASEDGGNIPSSSSSESSDELESERIREAVVADCYTYLNPCNKSVKDGSQGKKPFIRCHGQSQIPSNRPSNKVEENNELGTTPEFRNFVAKKLSQLLDSMYEEKYVQLSPASQVETEESEGDGLKLLSSSTGPIVLEDATEPPALIRRKRKASTSSDSSEEERLAQAVVMCDFVFPNGIPSSRDVSLTNGHQNGKKTKKKKKKEKMKTESKKSRTECVDEKTKLTNGNEIVDACDSDAHKHKKKKKKRKKDFDSEKH